MHQIDLMKDDKRSIEATKEGDVHVERTGVDMLTQRDVSLKELNLLKRKNEFTRVSGKLIVSINKPIVVKRMDGFDLKQGRINLSKKRSSGKIEMK
jgi:hypothetical protein